MALIRINSRVRSLRREWVFLAGALVWLVLAWAAAIAVDVFDVFGLQARMPAWDREFPLLWYQLFSEASPTEWLQWVCQGAAVITAVWAWLRARRLDAGALQLGWFVLAAGLCLMLVEDSLNLRHLFHDEYFRPFAVSAGLDHWPVRVVWELVFYSLLAGLMGLGAVMLLVRIPVRMRTLAILGSAYAVYGLVGFGSALRRMMSWQERFGNWVLERFALPEIPTWAVAMDNLAKWRELVRGYDHQMGYMLIDHWFEESVELLAAGLLVTGVILLARDFSWFAGSREGAFTDR